MCSSVLTPPPFLMLVIQFLRFSLRQVTVNFIQKVLLRPHVPRRSLGVGSVGERHEKNFQNLIL